MPTMLAAVAAFLVVAPAGAGPGYDAHFVVQHIFDAADRDGSRTLTRAE